MKAVVLVLVGVLVGATLGTVVGDMAVAYTRQRDVSRKLLDALIEVNQDILQPLETAGSDDLPILRASAIKLTVRLQEIIDDPIWKV